MTSHHEDALRKVCRLCGSMTALQEDRNPYDKAKYCKLIQQAFDIDVNGEDGAIFPPYICKVCERKLARYKLRRQRKQPAAVNIDVPNFLEHSKGCSICGDQEMSIDALLKSCEEVCPSFGLSMVRQGDRTLFVDVTHQTANVCTIPKCVTIFNDGTWHISIVGQELAPAHAMLSNIPNVLNTDNAKSLLSLVGTSDICIGNPDFVEFLERKGNSSSRVYVLDKSYAIKGVNATVRSRNCRLIADKKSRCNVCSITRGDLTSWKDKVVKDMDKTSPSSSTPLSTLSSSELRERTRKLHREKAKSDKKVRNLQKKVRQVFNSTSFEFKDSCNDTTIKDFVNVCSKDIDELLPQNSAHRYLWEEQQKALKVGDKRQMRWSPTILRWCIAIHHKSPAAYKLLKESGLLILPAQSTLHKYTHYAEAKTGVHKEIVEQMLKEMDLAQDFKRNISLLFDEMKLQSGLVFSSSGKLMGFVDVGDINCELRAFEEELEGEKEPPLATHAFVLMARAIFSSTKQAIAFFPSRMLRSSDIYDCVMQSIVVLESAGLKVRALISDGASVNRKFYKMCTPSSGVHHWSVHPLDTSRKIFFFCDVPHLLKTTRNNLENSGFGRKSRNLKFHGRELRWTHLISLFEWDTGSDLRMLPKVSHDHLYLNPSTRMRVKLATQVLSQSVANGFKVFMEEKKDCSMEGTREFIELINKFFDCMNVTSALQGRRKRNDNLLPYESISDNRFDWLQNVFLKYFDDWEREIEETPNLTAIEKERRCISRETRVGLRITVSSFIELTKDLLQEEGVKYVLSEKFTQDPIEEYFSKQRRAGGSSDNPSVQQVANNMLSIQVAGSAIRASKAGNVEQTVSQDTSNCPLPKRRKLSKK